VGLFQLRQDSARHTPPRAALKGCHGSLESFGNVHPARRANFIPKPSSVSSDILTAFFVNHRLSAVRPNKPHYIVNLKRADRSVVERCLSRCKKVILCHLNQRTILVPLGD